MSVPMVSIVAQSSGTGKTMVMETLITEMVRRGYRVGAIKNDAHRLKFDQEGKDSWRFDQAGAWATALLSGDRTILVRHTESQETPDDAAALMEGMDLILIEGYRHGNKPKIEVVRRETGLHIISPPQDLLAVVTDTPMLATSAPLFSFTQVAELADLLVETSLRKKSEDRIYAEDSPSILTHFDANGRARMVDVTEKNTTYREAVATGEIAMAPETLELVRCGRMKKGDVLAVAQVAAIMAVKETSRIIPMCHPLAISGVDVDFRLNGEKSRIETQVKVKITGQTGVEMEALTGVSAALLTVYDMCKAVDKNMVISNIRLLEKKGGRSGHFQRKGEEIWEK